MLFRSEATQEIPSAGTEVDLKHPFEMFRELNQNQVLAEERFRQARRRCNELGVDVLYDAQSSSFAQDDEGEQTARAVLARCAGPDKYPDVQTWLDGISGDVTAANWEGIDVTPSAGSNELDRQPWALYDDSWSAVAPGAGKGRIQRDQAARDVLREEAKEQWAESMGVLKEDWDAHHWG